MYPLVDEIIINDAQILIKFGISVKTSTLVNDNFKLYSPAIATPATVGFKPIVLADDYNSISRILTLNFDGVLDSETDYVLEIANIKNAAGVTQTTSLTEFTTDNIDTVEEDTPAPAPTYTYVDYTIDPDAFDESTIDIDVDAAATPSSLTVTGADPPNWDYYLPEDYNSGRITIKFNVIPSASYINGNYFKVQRKAFARGPGRWENLSSQISFDSDNPWVYINLPSNDATPVYGEAGKVYFEENYKYRVLISKEITT